MKKYNYVLIILSGFTFISALSSNPQYYNYNNGTQYDSAPLNISTGKCIQTYIAPGEFVNPTPAPYGIITKFSIRISPGYPLGPVTYTNFRIIFLDTTIAGGNMQAGWYSGTYADTVFYRVSLGPLTAPAGSWYDFILDHPHFYDNSKGLVITIEQASASGTYSGFSLQHTMMTVYRRLISVGGPPFSYLGRENSVVNCGVDITYYYPECPNYLYYKFDNNPNPTSVYNYAIPGVGNYIAPFSGLNITGGGQFGNCISGTGNSGAGIVTGWNCNLGTSSWTISMWLTIPSTSSGSAYYLFGDLGSASFRCFHNGVAGQNNLVLRGGFTDVNVTGIGPAPTVVTFVYDSAAGNIKAYKNGILAVTSNQTINIITGTGFKAGGYGTNPSFTGKMDEFRLYRKALSALDVLVAYNRSLSCYWGSITNTNNQIPAEFNLKQNYPNPFNPVTTISFGIPKAGFTKLIVYDILGREVKRLVNTDLRAGNYNVDFNASNFASGSYFYSLTSGGYTETRRMMLIK